jgi:hypothetical protein
LSFDLTSFVTNGDRFFPTTGANVAKEPNFILVLFSNIPNGSADFVVKTTDLIYESTKQQTC